MKQAHGITEQLKSENQLIWVQKLNNIKACTREIVEKEMIYNETRKGNREHIKSLSLLFLHFLLKDNANLTIILHCDIMHYYSGN